MSVGAAAEATALAGCRSDGDLCSEQQLAVDPVACTAARPCADAQVMGGVGVGDDRVVSVAGAREDASALPVDWQPQRRLGEAVTERACAGEPDGARGLEALGGEPEVASGSGALGGESAAVRTPVSGRRRWGAAEALEGVLEHGGDPAGAAGGAGVVSRTASGMLAAAAARYDEEESPDVLVGGQPVVLG